MRVLKTKRGVEAVNLLVMAVIAIIVLLILMYILRRAPEMFGKASSCEGYGTCIPNSEGCTENYFPDSGRKCPTDAEMCCVPLQATTSESVRFSSSERQALTNPISVLLDKNPKPVSELAFKEGEKYQVFVKFNDQLQEKSFGPIAIYVSSSKNPKKIYILGTMWVDSSEIGGWVSLIDSPLTDPGIFEYVVKDENKPDYLLKETNKKEQFRFDVRPDLKNTYDSYTLNVVVLDKMKLHCRDKQGTDSAWVECLKSTPVSLNLPSEKELLDLVSTRNYVLASKSVPVKIQRLVSISGVSTAWLAEDTVSIGVSDQTFDKVGVQLVNADSLVGLDAVVDACTAVSPSSFKTEVTNVVGTTIATSGIPLNINIGGFRVPTSSSQLKYIVDNKPIVLAKGKADVKIDKATMLKTFKEEGGASDATITGSNSFLCVRAWNSKDATKSALAVSDSPLKVDVLPPDVTNDDIKLIYPEITINTPELSQMFPSMAGQSRFYQQYPRIIIACRDYSQSGCSNYDYYLKTGNYVDVQVQGGLEEGLLGIALQFGLNKLFNYFALKDPLNTICPPIYSTSEFRQNTRPEINLRVRGQGIICLRVRDKAGNAVMLWKEIWNPQELMDRIATEVIDDLTNSTS